MSADTETQVGAIGSTSVVTTSGAAVRPGAPLASTIRALAIPPETERVGFWPRLRAGLAFALWLLPGFIAGSSVGLYVLGQNILSSQEDTGGLIGGIPEAIVYTVGGAVIGILSWVFIGWLAGRYCTAVIANADEFHKLAGRLSAVDAAISTIPMPDGSSTQKRLAVEEAIRDRDRAVAWLSWQGADQQWAFGDLYVSAWRYVHSAEEALVDILPASVITADAHMSLLRLHGSAIGDRAKLETRVNEAIKTLDPEGSTLSVTDASNSDGDPVSTSAETPDDAKGNADTQDSTPGPKGGDPQRPTPSGASIAGTAPAAATNAAAALIATAKEDAARAQLRAVKTAINDFRDGRSDQLVSLGRKVRIRHVALSIIVALLFEMGILALDPAFHLVEAFAVYFLVGALAGIALEAQRSNSAGPTSAQDYGLNRERLFLTFSMAGVAACGGVILFVMLLDTTVANLLASDRAAFDPKIVTVTPVLLLVAAAFGLAPSRLFTAVTGLSEQILLQSELTSSTPTGASSEGKGTGGDSAGDKE